MGTAYVELKERFYQLSRLDHAITFLQWDQLVMMPPGGSNTRAEALAELTGMRHNLLVAPEMGDLLARAEEENGEAAEKRSIAEMAREYRQAVCLPAELVKAQSLAGSTCEHGWRTQRQENDWPGFLTNFREVVHLARQEAQHRQQAEQEKFATPYDALLDLHCTGDSSTFIDGIFARLRAELPSMLAEVVDKQQQKVDIGGEYPLKAQKQLSEELMRCLGFDFSAGRLDVSMHPFSTGDVGDQRITTRYRTTDFIDALTGTAHETGHASYEAGLPKAWEHLPVGQACNMCIHESQSLLFEKQLFLSRPFLAFFTPQIHRLLPAAAALGTDDIYRAATRVEPSYIRVEADEVSYPLHVILRYEIERDLINGHIEAEDIPELWDSKMLHYLGLSTKDNYRDGCLQDIHWTDGSFGYFPSYTLGAINASQLFTTIVSSFPDWQERVGAGEVHFIRQWLAANVWSVGSTRSSQEIMVAATGETSNAEYLLAHIRRRYLDGRG